MDKPVKERPILFKGPMVLAILRAADDPLRKTETRRLCPHAVDKGGQFAGSVHPTGSGRSWIAWWRAAWPAATAEQTARLYPGDDGFRCPYGIPGDRLWVREVHAIATGHMYDGEAAVRYFVGDPEIRSVTDDRSNALPRSLSTSRRRPSIHMPRWASRLDLEVRAVRVERLHDIDDAGARAEGVADREAFRVLWSEINGAESWDSNPWVWVVGFSRVTS